MILLTVISTLINIAWGGFAGLAIGEATEAKWQSAFKHLAISFSLFFVSVFILVYKITLPA